MTVTLFWSYIEAPYLGKLQYHLDETAVEVKAFCRFFPERAVGIRTCKVHSKMKEFQNVQAKPVEGTNAFPALGSGFLPKAQTPI